MRIRQMIGLAAAALGATTVLGATAGPASAASSGDTTTTFTVTGGALNITVPDVANLGSGNPGGTVTAQLGAVAVTDGRAALPAAWTASAASTAFTTGGGTGPETVANGNVSYWSGPATATTGSGTFTPGQVNAGAEATMNTTLTAFALSGGAGDNSATWNPTVSVAVPAGAVAGTYTGTITHSVA
jgi:hypothetical protein